nr:hypothetical protein [Tanacetum cinerariifolium]
MIFSILQQGYAPIINATASSSGYQGHIPAKEFVIMGLQTTVFTNSDAHAVMADGGVIAPVGLNMVALAAQRQIVPFVVLPCIHKSHSEEQDKCAKILGHDGTHYSNLGASFGFYFSETSRDVVSQ